MCSRYVKNVSVVCQDEVGSMTSQLTLAQMQASMTYEHSSSAVASRGCQQSTVHSAALFADQACRWGDLL